jgi:GNAT superfamily N-acetyltransferase
MVAESEIKETTEISTQVIILPVSYAAILDDPNADTLLRAYAEDCLVPNASPQRPLYAAMEEMGSIQCFAAYLNQDSGNLLIGFVSVIRTVVLHDGHLIAAVESLFVDRIHRSTGAGLLLVAAAKRYATESGCRCLLASARMGSALDLILSRRPDCDRTHAQYTFWLNGHKGGRA